MAKILTNWEHIYRELNIFFLYWQCVLKMISLKFKINPIPAGGGVDLTPPVVVFT